MKTWKVLGVSFFDLTRDGFFVGVGAHYDFLNHKQESWGKGVSNIITSAGANSNGVAEGSGAPFHNTNNVLEPSVQLGYYQHFAGTPN